MSDNANTKKNSGKPKSSTIAEIVPQLSNRLAIADKSVGARITRSSSASSSSQDVEIDNEVDPFNDPNSSSSGGGAIFGTSLRKQSNENSDDEDYEDENLDDDNNDLLNTGEIGNDNAIVNNNLDNDNDNEEEEETNDNGLSLTTGHKVIK